MSITSLLGKLFAPIYFVVVGVLIFVLSSSPYEFMIGEVDDGKKMTFCDLPKALDDGFGVCCTLTGVFAFALLLSGIVFSLRLRRVRPALVLGFVLVLFWAYRFFMRQLGC